MKLATALVLCLATCTVAAADDLLGSPRWDTDGWVPRSEVVEVELSRPLEPDEGELKVFLGSTDVTGLFRLDGAVLRSRPEVGPLPAGDHEMVVHLAASDAEWREIGRYPLRVLYPGGFERVSYSPSVDLDGSGQADEGHSPPDNAPPRDSYLDGTGRFGLRTEHGREGFKVTTEIETVGVTRREQALRFSTERDDAPKYDLARYRIGLEWGDVGLEAGHLFVGEQPQLIDSFSSRGIGASWQAAPWLDLSVAGVNGTSIVGWSNALGLSRSEHRVMTATVGVELLPSRPGGLRIAATWLDASLEPLSGFTQGAITDAEESSGWGVRVTGSDPSQRLTVDAGYARSTFDNPFDPDLAVDGDLVPVEQTTRDARYARLTYQVLRGLEITDSIQAGLSLGFRHEYVEPLYRSPTAFQQADVDRNRIEANATIGPVSLVAGFALEEDNLDEIASILTTRTRGKEGSAAVPLARLFSPDSPSPWWPTLSVSFNQTHQYGLGIPVDGGFSPSHVPDHFTKNGGVRLDWQGARWRVGYSLNGNDQDSRQEGRENADFTNRSNAVSIGYSPTGNLDLGAEAALEKAERFEVLEVEDTVRLSGSLRWQVGGGHSLDVTLSRLETENDDKDSTREDIVGDATWSWRLTLGELARRPLSGRLFVRYSNRQALVIDPVFELFDDRLLWTVSTGLNLSWGS